MYMNIYIYIVYMFSEEICEFFYRDKKIFLLIMDIYKPVLVFENLTKTKQYLGVVLAAIYLYKIIIFILYYNL